MLSVMDGIGPLFLFMVISIRSNDDTYPAYQFNGGEKFTLEIDDVLHEIEARETNYPTGKAHCANCFFDKLELCSAIICSVSDNSNKQITFVECTKGVNARTEQDKIVAQKKELHFY